MAVYFSSPFGLDEAASGLSLVLMLNLVETQLESEDNAVQVIVAVACPHCFDNVGKWLAAMASVDAEAIARESVRASQLNVRVLRKAFKRVPLHE
jgi:hypothetical protein